MDSLVPMEGYVLVELSGDYAQIELPDKQYATKTSGIVLKEGVRIPTPGIYSVSKVKIKPFSFVGKTVYFEAYKDDIKAGDNLAFIKTEYIAGYVEAN